MRDSFKKFGAIFLLISPLIFFILSTIAMYLFPGGFAIDGIIYPATTYRFKLNFFSDLGLLTTVTGKSNLLSCILFSVGIILVAIAFIFHSITLSSYFSKGAISQKIAEVGSVTGILAALGFIGIACTPVDVLPLIHHTFVLIGFSFAGIYCINLILAMIKEKTYPNIRGFLPITFIIALIVFLIVLLDGPPHESFPGRILQAITQKVIGYQLLILLMVEAAIFLILLKKRSVKS